MLIDAPCSGLGTLRRNPDLKWRQTPEVVAQMAALQRLIVQSASRLLKPGGRLVYATCSLLQEENEEIARQFSEMNPDFEALDVAGILEALKIPQAQSLCSEGESGASRLRLWPHRHKVDGFFAAVWQKKQA